MITMTMTLSFQISNKMISPVPVNSRAKHHNYWSMVMSLQHENLLIKLHVTCLHSMTSIIRSSEEAIVNSKLLIVSRALISYRRHPSLWSTSRETRQGYCQETQQALRPCIRIRLACRESTPTTLVYHVLINTMMHHLACLSSTSLLLESAAKTT